MQNPTKAAVILSGGLDSTTLAYMLHRQSHLDRVISIYYGQTHSRELDYAKRTGRNLAVPHHLIDMRDVMINQPQRALTGDVGDVPDGHYTADSMKKTVVPNRNALLLSIGASIAAGHGCDVIGYAAHSGDHAIYPDCRPEFVSAFKTMLRTSLGELWSLLLYTPFIDMSKADIVRAGHGIGVPFEDTWSCYKGGNLHCGRCGTCVERAEAFHLAGVKDPTAYHDPNYWKTQCGVT